MRTRRTLAVAGALAGALLLSFGARPALAHRLDEYLQATMIAVGKERVQLQLRLTPGVAVAPRVLAGIDANADGVLSDAERQSYAERVVRDPSLAIDGERVPLRLLAATFSDVAAMRAGLGDITIDAEGDVPRGAGGRTLTVVNRHQRAMSVYLVNALVPRDPDIRITAQRRSVDQSSYRLDYVQSGAGAGPRSLAWWSGTGGWIALIVLLSLAQLALLWRRRADEPERTSAARIAERDEMRQMQRAQ